MIDAKCLSPEQLDALKEVANIGSGHAATSLSQLMGKKVMVRVPKILTGPLEDVILRIADPNDVVVSVLMYFLGDLTGRTLLLYPYEDGQELTSLLMPAAQENSAEVQESLLKEVSNILSCSYMNALGELLGLLILPSVPGMIVDMVGAVLSSVVLEFGREKDFIFCVESEFDFGEMEKPLRAYFLLLPDTTSLELILKKLNIMK
ncbi:chemotaxis protein CheC [candidate division WOR-3 bacterium]|nr:chemotaxis protein CheC [candidate division WOR-3 bacterium]